MKCPECGAKTEVYHRHPNKRNRYRRCKACGFKFKTIERMSIEDEELRNQILRKMILNEEVQNDKDRA